MELLHALAAFAEEPGPTHGRLADLLGLPCAPDPATFSDVFLFNLYPYASVYLGGEGKLGGDARDRVAGFFRALGSVPGPEPDHVTVLLAAYAGLRRTDDHRAAHAATVLLHEHLLSWLPLYLARVQALAPPPYPQWAALVARVMRAEAQRHTQPGLGCTHLRHPPGLADPDADGHDAFVDSLLAPLRSGFVVTGADLVHAARRLGLGLRIGERRFVLNALLAQQPAATLRWLAEHTATTGDAWRPWVDDAPDLARWWVTTAEATRATLLDLALDVDRARLAGAAP